MTAIITAVNLSAIDLNLLYTLHVVLETRSVATAARRLRVTAPAVSNALARLRHALGDPLLVRRGRGVVPTPRALELAPVLARTLGELEAQLARDEPFDPRTCARELTIALSDADQVASLPAIARTFARRMPRARLRVVSLDVLTSSGGLAGTEVDATIGPPLHEPGIRQAKAYEETAVFVAREGHPRLRGRLGAAAFDAEGHVDIHLLLGRPGAGHRQAEDAFARAGLSRRIAIVVPTFFAAAIVVSATDLITGMPLRVARALQGAFAIQLLRGPPGPAFRFEQHLSWHERTDRDPAATAFRALILEALRGRARGVTARRGGAGATAPGARGRGR